MTPFNPNQSPNPTTANESGQEGEDLKNVNRRSFLVGATALFAAAGASQYIASNIEADKSKDLLLGTLEKSTGFTKEQLTFMRVAHEKYGVAKKLSDALGVMTPQEVEILKEWRDAKYVTSSLEDNSRVEGALTQIFVKYKDSGVEKFVLGDLMYDHNTSVEEIIFQKCAQLEQQKTGYEEALDLSIRKMGQLQTEGKWGEYNSLRKYLFNQ